MGDKECELCHSEIYRTFKQTGMGRSFYLPGTDNVIEDYLHDNRVHDVNTGFYYEMIREGESFYQVEYSLDNTGERVHELRRKIDYIMGSGNHNRSYISDINGFLFEMPVTWYSEKEIWDLSPGYHNKNLRFSRPVVPECMNCHNSYAQSSAFSQNHFTEIPHGIGCERCHGPGELHVSFRESEEYGHIKRNHTDSTIVNPARLSYELQLDVCRQCHLQGEMRVLKAGKRETDFRPGMRLADFSSFYFQADLNVGDFRIASHGARIPLSACFKKSGGRLTCTYCHDPHQPVQWLKRTWFNQKCQTCHDAETLSQSEVAEHDADSDCVACHMKQGATSDILHVNFTDHWIRREIQVLSKVESDSMQAESLSHAITLLPASEETDNARDIRLGIAYVKYFEAKHSDRTYLDRAVTLLEPGITAIPGHADGRYYLGVAHMQLGNLGRAEEHFRTLVKNVPEHALAHFQLARVLQTQGKSEEAIKSYNYSLSGSAYLPEVYNNMGNIYAAHMGNVQKATGLYQQAIAVLPSYAQAYNNMAELLIHKNELAKAETYLAEALKLEPHLANALHNLATLRLREGKLEAAKALYYSAIAAKEDFAPSHANLAIILSQQKEYKEALEHAARVVELLPGDERARSLFQSIKASYGPH